MSSGSSGLDFDDLGYRMVNEGLGTVGLPDHQ